MLIGNLLLDLVVVIAIAGGFYIGWHRGFIGVVLKNFAGLFSAVLAFQFFEGLGAKLKEKYILSFVHDGLENAIAEASAGVNAEGLVAAVPGGLARLASLVGIDLAGMAEKALENGQNSIASFVDAASASIAQILSNVVAFAILFFAFVFVLRVLSLPLNKIIMKLPIIGTANRALGLLFGALGTLIITWLAIQLIGFLDASIGLSFIEVADCAISGIFYRFHIFS